MSADTTKFFQMRVSEDFTDDLDRLRKMQDDLPNRSEMIKRLVRYAMKQQLIIGEGGGVISKKS